MIVERLSDRRDRARERGVLAASVSMHMEETMRKDSVLARL